MTWGEIKQRLEALGVREADTVEYIDWHSHAFQVRKQPNGCYCVWDSPDVDELIDIKDGG